MKLPILQGGEWGHFLPLRRQPFSGKFTGMTKLLSDHSTGAEQHSTPAQPITLRPPVGGPFQPCDSSREQFNFEYPIWQYYRARPWHLIRLDEALDWEQICQENECRMLRSNSECKTHDQDATRWKWGQALFDFGAGVFIIGRFNRRTDDPTRRDEDMVSLVAYAPTPAQARERLDWMMQTYALEKKPGSETGFILVSFRGGCFHTMKSAPIVSDHRLSAEQLALHYGEDFAPWSAGFVQRLSAAPCGLSILRGPPGTGKTSFLRHLMQTMRQTHRFYHFTVPDLDCFNDAEFLENWEKDRKIRPEQIRVLVFEDAETFLMRRDADNRGQVSALLNLTDGLLGNHLWLHVICTVNCEFGQVDEAVLRAGRLLALREFKPLPYAHAARLAVSMGATLPEEKSYTLAEIFNPPTPLREPFGADARCVGFR